MRFDRLRLAGFKSFVDSTELRIADGLTGVVGPNGCGKSNLLEAIRWVMGESSPKSLRGGGMEDVIFAGTAQRPGREFADVTLALDNSRRSAPAQFNDSDQIEVVRRIERGLGSAYRLNGRDVRQKDVQLLFADAATGAHSPALVSQGRIGAIISAKPQERRAMLEEAAGIAGLHVRRKDAEIRLRAAEANLTRLDDVLANMEAQAATLKRQARQAERYRTLSAAIEAAEAELLHARWQEADRAARVAAEDASVIEAKLADAVRLAAALSARQAEATAGLPTLRQAEAEAAAAMQALTQAGQSLTAELAQIERRQRELADLSAAVARDLDREAGLAVDAEEALARLAAEREVLAARIAGSAEMLERLAEVVRDAEVSASADERVLAERIAAQAEAQGARRSAENAVAAAEQRRTRATSEAERLDREAAALATGANDDGQSAVIGEIADADRAIAAAGAEMESADSARTLAEAAREVASTALAAARGALGAMQAERDALVRMTAQTGATGGATALDSVRVVAGWEKALAAALGNDLSAAVGAGEGGRRWTGADASGDPAFPKDFKLLADLVDAPVELHRRLRQIAVVEVLPASANLAVGQRLVSKNGRLLRWDGFRSDGGTASATAERLEQRNRLAALEAELPAASARVAAAEAALTTARGDYDMSGQRERAAREARAAAERTRHVAQQRLAEMTAAAERRASRVEAIRVSVARLRAEAAEAEAERSAAISALAALPHADTAAAATAEAREKTDASRASLATARADHAALARSREADAARLDAMASESAGWARRKAASAAQTAELNARAGAAADERAALAGRPAEIARHQATLAGDVSAAVTARTMAAERLAQAETAVRTLDAELRTAGEASADAREARARLGAQREHQEAKRAELNALSGERFQCPPPVLAQRYGFDDDGDPQQLTERLQGLTLDRERIGPVNLRADLELAEIEETVAASTAERGEIETAIARLRGSIGSLNREGRVRLLAAFEAVNGHFKELFETLFDGGQAHLELIESDDPLDAGLEIMAQPPGKKLQSLTLLSGGEQALTAIALIFGLFLTNPAPICVLDEVDAPLDDANVERFCDLLDRMTTLTDTRFLIVTHNAVTMSRMHRLYGVTMAEQGVSQLVSVDLARAELLLAAE